MRVLSNTMPEVNSFLLPQAGIVSLYNECPRIEQRVEHTQLFPVYFFLKYICPYYDTTRYCVPLASF